MQSLFLIGGPWQGGRVTVSDPDQNLHVIPHCPETEYHGMTEYIYNTRPEFGVAYFVGVKREEQHHAERK